VSMPIIQVRGISAKAHRRLKAKASKEGKSLSEYLRGELEHLAEQPSLDDWLERVASREPVPGVSAAEDIRAAREEHDARLDRRNG
jgi:antitoxin FitA